MQTGIVDGIELAAYICQGDCFALDLKLSDCSGRDSFLFAARANAIFLLSPLSLCHRAARVLGVRILFCL